LICWGPLGGHEGTEMSNLRVLVVTVILSLLLAVGASFAVVVSQNSAAQVRGPSTNYGPAAQPSP
jgi:hypothetical protein